MSEDYLREKTESLKSSTFFKKKEKPICVDNKEYLNSVFSSLDANNDKKLSKTELQGYEFDEEDIGFDAFCKLLKKGNVKQLKEKFEIMPEIEFKQDEKTGKIILTTIDGKSFVHDEMDRIWAHSSKIKGIDFTKDPVILEKMKFTDSTFEDCKFPQGFDLNIIIENGKNPGLNIKKMQKMSTGKNIHAIIIDNPLTNHNDFKDKNITTKNTLLSTFTKAAHQHGTSVTGILTQIAPDVNVQHFGMTGSNNLMKTEEPFVFQEVLKSLETTPQNKKPKIISTSAYIQNPEKTNPIIEKIQKEHGCWVLSVGEFDKNFGYLDKINPAGNPDDFENYRFGYQYSEDIVYINSGDRTLPSAADKTGYRHDSKGCASWAVPTIAGLYVAAAEVKPDITPEEFIQVAKSDECTRKIIITDEKELERIGYDILSKEKLTEIYNESARKLYPDKSIDEILNNRIMRDACIADGQKHFKEKYANKALEVGKSKERFLRILDAEKLIQKIKNM
ncbi:hypothetical protein J6Q66_07755 [bacterium]|nr:hypothetical protein [bacterium]